MGQKGSVLSHLEDDLEEDDELANSDVREVYKQASNNMRAFVVLRFRHFATFSVIMAFVTTAVFQIPELATFKVIVTLFGVVVTVLFWALDYRTAEYLKYHARVAFQLEAIYFRREKRIDISHIERPKPRYFSATAITNLIFLLILIGWGGLMWAIYVVDLQPRGHAAATAGELTPDAHSNKSMTGYVGAQ